MSMLNLWRDNTPEIFPRDFEGFFKEMDKSFRKGVDTLFAAPTDIHETEKDFVVALDLPGIKKEEINVEVAGNQVSVFGERKYEHKDKTAKTHRLECWKGQFRRTFTLPENVDSQKVDAAYENGVLKLTIPKSELSLSKKVSIK